MKSLGASYKTGNIWGLLNTSRPVAYFQHDRPTRATFLTYAPELLCETRDFKTQRRDGNENVA